MMLWQLSLLKLQNFHDTLSRPKSSRVNGYFYNFLTYSYILFMTLFAHLSKNNFVERNLTILTIIRLANKCHKRKCSFKFLGLCVRLVRCWFLCTWSIKRSPQWLTSVVFSSFWIIPLEIKPTSWNHEFEKLRTNTMKWVLKDLCTPRFFFD